MKLLVNKQECDEVRNSFVTIETKQRKVVGNRIYSPIRDKVLESTTRATYNKFIIYKQPISEKVLNIFKYFVECKCIRFTGGDKWYPNGCKIHPNG